MPKRLSGVCLKTCLRLFGTSNGIGVFDRHIREEEQAGTDFSVES
jgi:hypothetical protein